MFAADVAAVTSITKNDDDDDDNDGFDYEYAYRYEYGSAADGAVEVFLRSVDPNCLDRNRTMTRATAFRFDEPVHYEAEQAFVWAGTDGGSGSSIGGPISIRGPSAAELGRQLDKIRSREYRDWVRVDMAVEIAAGEDLHRKGSNAGWTVGGLWDRTSRKC